MQLKLIQFQKVKILCQALCRLFKVCWRGPRHRDSNRSDEHEYEKNAEEERKNYRHDANIKLSDEVEQKLPNVDVAAK